MPTIQESGYPGYDVTLWYGLIGPKGMPTAVVQRINQEVNKILALPATPKKFLTDGAEPAGGTPEAFRKLISQEIKTWGDIVGKLDIKPH
ncbi:Tripartite tricarboxylate transporter family receptor [compost metagenome]